MSHDEPTPETPGSPGTPPGSTPPPPPSAPDYGYGTTPPGGGYGTPPSGGGGYGTPPGGGGDYGTPPGGGYGGGYGGYGGGDNGGYGAPPPPGGPTGPGAEGWSVGNAFSYGWTKFTRNWAPILGLALILLVGLVLFSIIGFVIQAAITHPSRLNSDGSVEPASSFWVRQSASAITSLLNFLVSTILGAIIIRGALDLTEGRPLDIGSIFGRLRFGQLFVLAVITSVITAIGFFLCFIPGLIAALFFYFATYFLLDRDLDAVDAIRASVQLVRNNLGSALVWAIVAFIVSFIGICLCGVGILVTYPVAIIGTAYTYKKLTGQPVAA